MTSGSPEDGTPFAVPLSAPERRRRRGGVNYPLIFAAVGVVGLAAAGAFMLTTPIPPKAPPAPAGNPSLGEARTCWQDRDFACAEADYRAYLAKYPNDGSTNAALAIALTQDGRHKEALPFYKHAVALGVATYDTYAGYAVSLDATGDVDDAIRYNYAALKLVPSLVDVRGALANELVRKGQKDEALNLLESFDQTLEDRGEAPYFQSQIDQIRSGTTGPQLAAANAAAGQAATGAAVPAGTQEIALNSDGAALYVPVLVDDSITLKFVVDSGASDVSIPADVVQTLIRMGKIHPGDFRGERTFELADGARVPSQLFVIHSMRVGNREVKEVMASITNRRGSPLLGQSFLKRFKSWSIDNRRRVLVLQN